MGLDTSHGCWHGPYSYFHEWRLTIAKAAGRTIIPDRSSNGEMWETHDNRECALNGRWAATPDDPLDVLLEHSDCDGVIQWEQAGPLADELEKLLPKMKPGDDAGDDRGLTMRFIAGLRKAATEHEDVEFA